MANRAWQGLKPHTDSCDTYGPAKAMPLLQSLRPPDFWGLRGEAVWFVILLKGVVIWCEGIQTQRRLLKRRWNDRLHAI